MVAANTQHVFNKDYFGSQENQVTKVTEISENTKEVEDGQKSECKHGEILIVNDESVKVQASSSVFTALTFG